MSNIFKSLFSNVSILRARRLQPVSRFGGSIALIVHFVCFPVAVFSAPMNDLVLQLEDWIDAHSDLVRNDTAYKIELVENSPSLQPNDAAMVIGNQTRGLYDPGTATITLVQPWDHADLDHQSVLLHELIHHRQSVAHYYCPAAQELVAYKLQEMWLVSKGLTLDVNWVGVVLASSCSARDIHPGS